MRYDDELERRALSLKYRDNKVVIQNKWNKRLLAKDHNASLVKDYNVENLIKEKVKELGCSKLEASEILRKTF